MYRLFQFLMRMLVLSWRIRYRGPDLPHNAMFVFWHDEMLPLWWFLRIRQPVALISASNDGEILAGLLHSWRYNVIRGSSTTGGKQAMREMTRALEQGFSVVLTPDGSRGPRHSMKPGAVVAAARAGRPVVLMTIKARGFRLMKSWDHFLIPWPFSAVDVHMLDVITPPNPSDRDAIDACIQMCEQKMNERCCS